MQWSVFPEHRTRFVHFGNDQRWIICGEKWLTYRHLLISLYVVTDKKTRQSVVTDAKQGRQTTCIVTLWGVCLTIVAVEKK